MYYYSEVNNNVFTIYYTALLKTVSYLPTKLSTYIECNYRRQWHL